MITLNSRDEREVAIDLAADRTSYLVLAFGVLAVAAWRGFSGEATWDLLALVIVSGAAGLVHRLVRGAVTRSWVTISVACVVGAALVAAIIASGGPAR